MIFQSTEDREAVIGVILAGQKLGQDEEAKFKRLMQVSFSIHIGYIKDEVACIWGLIAPSMLADQAYMWLHTTDVVRHHTTTFIRGSRNMMDIALENFASIKGDCAINNGKAVPWLKWLGAEFGEPLSDRIPFVIRRD